MAKTRSISQVMQRLFSFSKKKSTPSQVYPRQTHPAGYLSTTDLPHGKDVINEPGHADTVQLFIEELHTQPGISKTNSSPAGYLTTIDLPYSKDVVKRARSHRDCSASYQRNPHPARYIKDKLTQLRFSQQPTYLIAKT
jgi:hypothetical protein